MSIRKRPNRPYYAASPAELEVFRDTPTSDDEVLETQNVLASRILAGEGQGYTDSSTFQAVMWGRILDGNDGEPHGQAELVRAFGRYARVANEPFAMSYTNGRLTYIGFLRPNSRAMPPGDTRVHSIRTLSNETCEYRGVSKGALWGQAFVRSFRVGAEFGQITPRWTLEDSHELGVVIRSPEHNTGQILSLRDFEYPLGVPAISEHLQRYGQPNDDRKLNELIIKAREVYELHPFDVPGRAYPPVNNR